MSLNAVNKKRIITNITVGIAIVLTVICAVIIYSKMGRAEPENPLDNSTVQYILEGGIDNHGYGQAENGSDSNSSQAENSETDTSSNTTDESTPQNDNTPLDNTVNNADDTANDNTTESSNSTIATPNALPAESQSADESAGNVTKPVENPDESEEPYFTTTITDGEIVFSSDYRFEITQLRDDVKAQQIYVYVNNSLQVQFRGSCQLDEGKNTIRVAVDYVDGNNRKISVYKDYTVIFTKQEIVIDTNLCDSTTDEDIISFYAHGYVGEKQTDVTVTVNGESIQGNGEYTCTLADGANTIVLTCAEAEKSFTIVYNPPKQLTIITDLTDKTVNSDNITFTARAIGGDEKTKITVTLNGKTVTSVEGVYTSTLKIGSNTIRIKATDSVDSAAKNFTVKYVPVADEKTAPKISYINITEGMNIKGNSFTMNISAVDYNNNKIYSSGIGVKLNGKKQAYSWDSSYTSFFLNLVNGKNTVEIRITDADGRYSDFVYSINCTAVKDGDPIGTVTISLDANVLGIGYIIEPCEMTIYQGENSAQLLLRLLDENDITYKYNGKLDDGFYLSRISRADIALEVDIPQDLIDCINEDGLEWKDQKYKDSIGEFDYCQGSGWEVSVNDLFLNRGFSDCMLIDGDVIKIRYTLSYGKDIGGYITDDGDGNYNKIW